MSLSHYHCFLLTNGEVRVVLEMTHYLWRHSQYLNMRTDFESCSAIVHSKQDFWTYMSSSNVFP